MRKVRIALENFWPQFSFVNTPTYRLLSKHFEITVVKENPDFVMASVFGDINNVLRHKCPRIQFLGEPWSADFGLFDYVVGYDYIRFEDGEVDRYFRFPEAFWEWHNEYGRKLEAVLTRRDAEQILKKKAGFCCFIHGHPTSISYCGGRERILDVVSAYKTVDCAGKYRNNMPDGKTVSYSPEKVSFMEKYKFSIVGEGCLFPGFMTEKIIHAFAADTIPIYIGDPLISRTINPKAFINVSSFGSDAELLDYIKRLDQDDEEYMRILQQPKFCEPLYFSRLMDAYETFLVNALSKTGVDAIRRPTKCSAWGYEQHVIEANRCWKVAQNKSRRLINRIGRKLKVMFVHRRSKRHE